LTVVDLGWTCSRGKRSYTALKARVDVEERNLNACWCAEVYDDGGAEWSGGSVMERGTNGMEA